MARAVAHIERNEYISATPIVNRIVEQNRGNQEAFQLKLMLLVKQNQGGRELARSDIKSLLYLLVDIVIQFGVERHERFIKEIWYQPERKRA